MHLQGEKDSIFFDDTHDNINDHAQCLKDLRAFVKVVRTDLDKVISVVSENDRMLKQNLQGLEVIVTTQGNQIVEITDEVKVFRDKGAATQPGTDTAELQAKLATFEGKLETVLKQLE